jgi:SET domain-containing protein
MGKKKKKAYEVRDSPIHGKGVFAARNIKKGEDIIEYKGRLLTAEEADMIYEGDETGHTFLFTLNEEWVIDANVTGGKARWINHSCEPNCGSYLLEHPGDDRTKDKMMIEAIRNIKKGEELGYNYEITVDYRLSKEEKELWKCLCGSKKCIGTMIRGTK